MLFYTADLKAILDYHMPDVIKWINLIALLPYLISHGLLTQHERELLKNRTLTEEERKLELISLIDKKPEGHQKFLEALSEEHEHSGHKEIVNILTGSSKIVPATSKAIISYIGCPVFCHNMTYRVSFRGGGGGAFAPP